MVVAELEVFTSRPIAPTRRVALGSCVLPVDPAPGFGSILLGGIVARFAPTLDEDMLDEVESLILELERGQRIAQPRLRHRLQSDRIGLQRAEHRLLGDGDAVVFDIDEVRGTPAQHLLCAVYAAGRTPEHVRPAVLGAVRKGLLWTGPIDRHLVAHLAGRVGHVNLATIGDPVTWALGVLDLTRIDDDDLPDRRIVQVAFRDRVRSAHPDHGGAEAGAAERIAELTEARRILLG